MNEDHGLVLRTARRPEAIRRPFLPRRPRATTTGGWMNEWETLTASKKGRLIARNLHTLAILKFFTTMWLAHHLASDITTT